MTPASRWASVALLVVVLTSLGIGAILLVSQQGSTRSIRNLSSGFMRQVARGPPR